MLNEYIISPLWAVATLVLCGTIFGSCTVALICAIRNGLKEKRDKLQKELKNETKNRTD